MVEKQDFFFCTLTSVDPQERSTWKSGVRSARKGPTDVDDAPAPARN